MYWLGTTLQNLVKQSDAYQVGSAWLFQTSSLSTSGSFSSIRGPVDARSGSVLGRFSCGSGESFVSACDTIFVNSGEQIISSASFLRDQNVGGTSLFCKTPHGYAGVTFAASEGNAIYFSENSSAYAYFDESNLNSLTRQYSNWFRVKLSITARSSGYYSPLMFRSFETTGTFSEGVQSSVRATNLQTIINPSSRIYGVPAYIPTTGTLIYSDQHYGSEVNATDVSFNKKRTDGGAISISANRTLNTWGFSSVAELDVAETTKEVAIAINSFWGANSTVVLMNTDNQYDVVSGKITNDTIPMSRVSEGGDDQMWQSLDGTIKLESF